MVLVDYSITDTYTQVREPQPVAAALTPRPGKGANGTPPWALGLGSGLNSAFPVEWPPCGMGLGLLAEGLPQGA